MKSSRNPLGSLKSKCLAGAVCGLFVNAALASPIVGDFTEGTGTSSASHQFVGAAGEGWVTPWNIYQLNTVVTPSVTNTNPIYGTDNYLNVNISTGTVNNRRSSLNRQFDPSALELDLYTIEFSLRMDSLTGFTAAGDGFGIFATSGNAEASTSTANQTWGISVSGDNQLIHFSNGPGNGGAVTSVSTGISLLAGNTYTFTITVDAAVNQWYGFVSDGTNSYSSTDPLGFRTNGNAGSRIYFNTLMSGSGDNWTYSLSGVNITAIPEPGVGSLLSATALALLILRRKWKRPGFTGKPAGRA